MDGSLGGIPPEDLPEPIRRLLEEAMKRGADIKVLKIPKDAAPDGILSQVMQLEDAADGEQERARLECGCQWCKLEHELHLVNKTTKLTGAQKYEAADALFKETAKVAEANGDGFIAFSLHMQALHYQVHQKNRAWFKDAADARIKAVMDTIVSEFGLDASDPKDTLRQLGEKVKALTGDGLGTEVMLKAATLVQMLKDLLNLHRTLENESPEFRVVRADNAQDLAQLI